jgi:hypothetical protein
MSTPLGDGFVLINTAANFSMLKKLSKVENDWKHRNSFRYKLHTFETHGR